MMSSATLTIRIDASLLAALRDKARREGRTVSAVIVELVRSDVQPKRARPRKRRRTMGMFADFEAPELDDLVRLRHHLSRRLMGSVAQNRNAEAVRRLHHRHGRRHRRLRAALVPPLAKRSTRPRQP